MFVNRQKQYSAINAVPFGNIIDVDDPEKVPEDSLCLKKIDSLICLVYVNLCFCWHDSLSFLVV